MDILLTCVVIFLSIVNFTHGLSGTNVCSEQQNYNLTTRVKYQQPVSVKTYRWCFDIPPKCSSVHTEMRDKWKIQTETRTKTVYFCCPGFVEKEDKCNPKCPEGVTGNNCNEDCLPTKWGPSCSQECRCPRNSVCDPKNGKCVCMDGWAGSNCDVPKEVFTRVPSFQTPSTKINDSKLLFDWSIPITVGPFKKASVTPSLVTSTVTKPLTTIATTTTIKTTSNPTTMTIVPSTIRIPTPKVISVTIDSIIENRTLGQQNNSTTVSSTVEVDSELNTTQTTTETSKVDITKLQIESPIPTIKTTYLPSATDSPITVILHNVSKISSKDAKPISRATESSIISLTVLKSTAVLPKRKPQQKITKIKQSDSELVKITLFNDKSSKSYASTTSSTQTKNESNINAGKTVTSGTVYFHGKNETLVKSSSTAMNYVLKPTQSSLDNNTFFTMVTTEIQTEEVKHVLTEPEQITSVAEDEEEGDPKDDLYSALSVGMGVATALILVATVIVFVARYRRSYGDRTTKMDIDRVHSMINVSEDEVSSGYLRSVFHSPLPEIPINTSGNRIHKTSFEVPFTQPIVIHTISPILMESFKEVLESHYDHPKPPRPASVSISTNQPKNVSFGTLPSSFRPQNSSFRFSNNANHVISNSSEMHISVTEEPINILQLEQSESHTLEMENIEPIYDEIPWRATIPNIEEIVNNGDEAVTEL